MCDVTSDPEIVATVISERKTWSALGSEWERGEIALFLSYIVPDRLLMCFGLCWNLFFYSCRRNKASFVAKLIMPTLLYLQRQI